MPRLMPGVFAYLVALPLLPPGPAGAALTALTLGFVWSAATTPPLGVDYRGFVALAPFLASALLAAARAPDPLFAAGILSFFLPGLVLFLIRYRNPGWPSALWLLAWTLFAGVLALSVIAGFIRLRLGAAVAPDTLPPEAVIALSRSTLLIVPNDICAAAILLGCPMALLAGERETPGALPWTRAIAAGTIALTALAIAILRSRAAFAVAIVEVAIVALAWRRAVVWPLAAAVCAFVADQAVGFGAFGKMALSNSTDNHGVAGRLGLWISAWAMAIHAPLLGHGAQSFGPEHGAYLPSWSPRFPERRVPWAHNLFLEIFAEQGIVGVAALLGLLGWWVPGLVRRRGGGIFALACLAGFGVAGVLELSFIRRWVPVVMFGVLGFAMGEPREALLSGKKN